MEIVKKISLNEFLPNEIKIDTFKYEMIVLKDNKKLSMQCYHQTT